jgi:multiple sugar transport system permease protein
MKPKRTALRRLLRPTVLYVLLLLAVVPFLFPTWWMITSSFKVPAQIFAFPPSLLPSSVNWTAYEQVFSTSPFARQYFNSMYIAVLVTIGTVTVSCLSGYALARMKFAGQNLIFLLLLCGLMLPDEVTIVPLYQLVRVLGLIDTHWPLILIPIFGGQSVFGTFIMRQFFLGIPGELEDAGFVDGLGRFGVFFRVALPLAMPSIAALAILAFLNSWNLFLPPLVYLSKPELFTLPVALIQYSDVYGEPLWNLRLAATTMSVVPVLVLFIVLQRYFVAGIVQGGLKG